MVLSRPPWPVFLIIFFSPKPPWECKQLKTRAVTLNT